MWLSKYIFIYVYVYVFECVYMYIQMCIYIYMYIRHSASCWASHFLTCRFAEGLEGCFLNVFKGPDPPAPADTFFLACVFDHYFC